MLVTHPLVFANHLRLLELARTLVRPFGAQRRVAIALAIAHTEHLGDICHLFVGSSECEELLKVRHRVSIAIEECKHAPQCLFPREQQLVLEGECAQRDKLLADEQRSRVV